MKILLATTLMLVLLLSVLALLGGQAAPPDAAVGMQDLRLANDGPERQEAAVPASPAVRPAPSRIPLLESTATRVQGRVVDSSGEPQAGMSILARVAGGSEVVGRTDAQGRFALRTDYLKAEHVELLVPAARGFDALRSAPCPADSADHRLVLRPAGDLRILAVDAGRAVERFGISWAYQDWRGRWRSGREWSRRYSDGVAVLPCVPAGNLRLILLPEDPDLAANPVLEFFKPPGATRISVSLPRRQAIPVRLRDREGRPVSGLRVELLRSLSPRGMEGELQLVDPGHLGITRPDLPCALRLDESTTDVGGQAMLRWRADSGPLLLRIVRPEGAVLEPIGFEGKQVVLPARRPR